MERKHPSLEALDAILSDGNLHTTGDLIERGLTRNTLWRAAKANHVVQYVRGVYCAPATADVRGVGLAALSLLNPGGVVCMLSAAEYHGLSDEDPMRVWIALDREETKNPARDATHLPAQTVWWQPRYMVPGVQTRLIAGVPVKITDPARTVVDLVRNRTKVGDEPAMRALHDYVRTGESVSKIWDVARAIGHLDAVEPFVRAADEFRESIPVRGM